MDQASRVQELPACRVQELDSVNYQDFLGAGSPLLKVKYDWYNRTSLE